MDSISLAAGACQWGRPGWWPVFPLVWLVVIVAVVVFVAWRRRRWGPVGRASGESRLAERFASGEIDQQEYRARLAVLREKP